MAISKVISTVGSKGHHTFTLTVTEVSTSIANNTSNLSFNFVISNGGSWDWYNWGNRITYTININGNTFTGSIPQYVANSTATLKTGNINDLAHNSDGKKTIDISFSVSDTTGASYTCGNASKSDTMVLSDLHKAPTLTYTIAETSSKLSGVSNTKWILGLSEKKFTITATPYDGESITSYAISKTDGTIISTSSSNQITINTNNLAVVDDKISLILKAIDTKNAIGELLVEFTDYVQYEKPNLITTSSNIKRYGQLSGKAKLNLNGTFYNAKIGNTTNDVSLTFKYWASNETEPSNYSNTIPSSAITKNNNNISISDWLIANGTTTITNIDSRYSYNFKIKIVDSFQNETYTELFCSKGEYLWCEFPNRVDFKKITVNGYNPFEYSEEETICGIYNNKPLYRRTFEGTGINTNIAIIENLDKLVNYSGTINSIYNVKIPFSNYYASESNYWTSILIGESNNIFLNGGSFFNSSSKWNAVLEYTKTTD